MSIATLAERAALVAAVRELADWLEQHPDLPASVHAHHPAYRTDDPAQARKEVADALSAGDLTPRTGYDGEPELVREFGPVRYAMHLRLDAVGELDFTGGRVGFLLPPELVPPDDPAATKAWGDRT